MVLESWGDPCARLLDRTLCGHFAASLRKVQTSADLECTNCAKHEPWTLPVERSMSFRMRNLDTNQISIRERLVPAVVDEPRQFSLTEANQILDGFV